MFQGQWVKAHWVKAANTPHLSYCTRAVPATAAEELRARGDADIPRRPPVILTRQADPARWGSALQSHAGTRHSNSGSAGHEARMEMAACESTGSNNIMQRSQKWPVSISKDTSDSSKR